MSVNMGPAMTIVLWFIAVIAVTIGLLLADHWLSRVFREERRRVQIRRARVEEACRKLYELERKEVDRG